MSSGDSSRGLSSYSQHPTSSPSTPASSVPSQSNPYTRVYNAASSAAAHAAQPILGYLAGAATPEPIPSTLGRTNNNPKLAMDPSPVPEPGSGLYSRTDTTSRSNTTSGTATPAGYAVASGTPYTSTTTTGVQSGAMRRGLSQDDDAKRKESRNLDSIISQFYSKAAQVITQSRFTHVQLTGVSESTIVRKEDFLSRGDSGSNLSNLRGGANLPSTGGKRSRNRWFNIELEESDIFREELRTWRSVTSLLNPSSSTSSSLSGSSRALLATYTNVPSMVIDVILDVSELSGNQVLVLNDGKGKRTRVDLTGNQRARHSGPSSLETSPKKCNITLERWTVSFRPSTTPASPELPGVYKHCIILFRALYTLVRALPTYELHRRQKRRAGLGSNELKIGCRLSANDGDSSVESSTAAAVPESKTEIGIDEPLTDDSEKGFETQDFAFAPIVTPIGTLDFTCKYRTAVDFSVEEIEAMLSSRFIDEDFFKPTMRKYSSSTGASAPIASRRTAVPSTSPLAGRDQQRSSYGSLTSRHPPTQASDFAEPDNDEGAFTSSARTKGSPAMSRVNSDQGTPDLARRPSIGTSHPFKSPSPSAQSVPRSFTTSQPQDVSGSPAGQPYSSGYRISGSPASLGPSSSLRYPVGTAPGSNTTTPSGASPGPPIYSSQLSYTKKTVPSPSAAASPPVSGLSAMNLGTSPGRSSSPSVTQPVPVPGTSAAIPLSSSPTPSIIKRYSSPRYSRSFGQGSSGSSPGDQHSYWGPESVGRRSRLSSAYGRDDIIGTSVGSGGMSAAPPTRQQGGLLLQNQPSEQQPRLSSSDADDIRSFLGLIDSRVQLTQGSPGSSSGFLRRSTVLNRIQAEEKLRHLADSVYRGGDPASEASSGVIQPRSSSSSEYRSTFSPAYGRRQSPSPDLYSFSPGEQGVPVAANTGGYLSTSAGSGSASTRIKASVPPMSSSIPEEDPSHLSHQPRQIPKSSKNASEATSAVGSVSGSAGQSGGHFPFPRYISSSMRRRSSQSSSVRPSLSNSPIFTTQQGSPDGSRRRDSDSPTRSGPHDDEEASPLQTEAGPESTSESPAPQYETGEEQTMGQLDLSTEQDEAQKRSTELSEQRYRWS